MPATSLNSEPCAVCLETLKDPRQLSCGHVYCCQCIQHLIDGADPFLCPKCRKTHSSLICATDLQKCENSTVKEKHKETSSANENPHFTCDVCQVVEPWKRFAYCCNHDLFMCAHCALFKHKNCSVVPADAGARRHVISNFIRAQDVQQKVTTLATVVKKLDALQDKLTKTVIQQDDQISQVHSCLSRNLQMFDAAMNNESAMAALIAQRRHEEASSEINSSHKTYSQMVEIVCKEVSDLARTLEQVNAQYCEIVPEKIKLVTNPFGTVCQQLVPVLHQLAEKGSRHTPQSIVNEVVSAIQPSNPNYAWAAAMGKDVIFDAQQRGMFDFGNGFKLILESHFLARYSHVNRAQIEQSLETATRSLQIIDEASLHKLAANAAASFGGGIWLCVADPYGSLAIARKPHEKLWSSSVKVLGYEVSLHGAISLNDNV